MSEIDRRRALGAQTRRRLMEATADALAESGARGVSLRAVSTAAGANFAAARYHFGSREALIAAVLRAETEPVYREQSELLDRLEAGPDDAPARAWVAAWARPFIKIALPETAEQRRLGRIVGHGLNDHSQLQSEVAQLAAATDARLIAGLTHALPGVSEPDLWLRLTVMASALAALSTGAFNHLLARARSERPAREAVLELLTASAVEVGHHETPGATHGTKHRS